MINSCFFHLFIFPALIFLWSLSPIRAATCHPDDESGLLAFKSGITRDPSGILSSWKKGTDCCSWNNVVCQVSDNHRVTVLYLTGKSDDAESFLSGTLSPSLAKLQHLEGFYLSNLKNITGSFPHFLLRLPKLKFIEIQNNRFSGPLPANIDTLSELQVFNVEGNQFTGLIPSSISNLHWLSLLNIGDNLLTGIIPLEIANLKRIKFLNLAGNHFSGIIIPDVFKSMVELQSLVLSRNRFSGELPPLIASLPLSLRYLDLGRNNLSGILPSYISKFTELEILDLSRNQFSGIVPKSLANLTKIVNLDLSRNLLEGPFPNLKVDIEALDLSYNQFQLKTIPEWVTSAVGIYSLKLAKCGINMSLDDWKPRQTEFYDYIDLSENEISGSPVRFFKEERQLFEFRALGNKLRFDLETVDLPARLRVLDLSRNLVFGKVPATVARLQKLNLSQNHLYGKLPATKFRASVFAGNDCLCGSPLAPCKV